MIGLGQSADEFRWTPSEQDLERLRRVVRRSHVRGNSAVSWYDHRLVYSAAENAGEVLGNTIYSNAYVWGGPRPISAGAAEFELTDPSPTVAPIPCVSMLAREGGWRKTRELPEWTVIEKPQNPRLVVRTDLLNMSADGSFSVPVPPYSETRLPGWATLIYGANPARLPVTRFYLNTKRSEASNLAATVAEGLRDAGLDAFLMKWLLSQTHDARTDSTVIYVESRFADVVSKALDELVPQAALVSARIPMFTDFLGPGRARAEDPGGQESFGQVASRRAADTLLAELSATKIGSRRRIPAELHFQRHLEPSSSGPLKNQRAALAQMLEFAGWLSDSAVWHGDTAGWLSRSNSDGAVRAAGADPYSGAMGPTLALAYASHASRSDEFVALMRAAARNVFSRLGELDHGFHSGPAGAAAILAEAAQVSEDPYVREVAIRALDHCAESALRPAAQWDVIGGYAGTALGISIACEFLNKRPPDSLRTALEALVEVDAHGTGWSTTVGRRRRQLDGMAHGRWGATLALDIGSRALGDDPYERQIGVSIDRALNRAEKAGWLCVDRRYDGHMESTSWCHGAAGSTIAALTLSERLRDCMKVVRAGIAQSLGSLAVTIDQFSGGLCHGAVGTFLSVEFVRRNDPDSSVPDIPKWAVEQAVTLDHPRTSIDLSLMTGASGIAIGSYVAASGLPLPVALTLRPPLRDRVETK